VTRAVKHPGQIGTLYQLAKKRNLRTSAPPKNTEISPLFKCDSATLSFYASKDGKITVSFSGWDASKVVLEDQDASKVVLEDQAFEVSWETYLGRAQGLGGRYHVEWGVPAHRCPRPEPIADRRTHRCP
jgi:hypothetical protein